MQALIFSVLTSLIVLVSSLGASDAITLPEKRSAIFPGIWASDGTWPGSVSLQWSQVEGAESYKVFKSTTPAELGEMIFETTSGVSFVDANAIPNVTYYYQLIVCTTSMCMYHEGYDDGYAGEVLAPAPPPSYLNATDGTYMTSVKLDWEYVMHALYYRLYRSTSPDLVGPMIYESTYETETDYIDIDVTPGMKYYYRIQSCISNQCSGYGDVESGYAGVDVAQSVGKTLAGGVWEIAGYFIHFAAGPFDWLYVTPDGTHAAKLLGMDEETGNFLWKMVQWGDDVTSFNSIESYTIQLDTVVSTTVGFGSYINNDSVINELGSILGNQLVTVDGYFIHYGTGPFDWIYMTPNTSLIAKLDGMDPSTGLFNWTILQTQAGSMFESITIAPEGDLITFGALQ